MEQTSRMIGDGEIENTGSGGRRRRSARLDEYLRRVRPADRAAMDRARERWDSLMKPIRGLGVLEEDIIKIAGMTGDEKEMNLRKSALVVMCADHGVVAEGVAQSGQEVTAIVANNFCRGRTSVSIMCETAGTDLFPIDIGMVCPERGCPDLEPSHLTDRRVAPGTENFVHGPAMSGEACVSAILVGIETAGELKRRGYRVLAAGEMGIGNTTASSALVSVLAGLSPEEAAGRGAGLSDEGMERKRRAVRRAVARYFLSHPESPWGEADAEEEASMRRKAEAGDALALLSELGGFDIAGMVGMFLGGAVFRIPVVIDGLISSAAALAAVHICPTARDYMLGSHMSSEPAAKSVMKMLGMTPPLSLNMHLGEGSGAVAYLPLLRMGADVYRRMSSFEEIQVEKYKDYEREGGTAG